MKRILTFTNSRGESITFKDGSSFVISNPEGLGDVQANIQSQKSAYQDGVTYIDSTLEQRSISFQVRINGVDDTDISQKRSRLGSLFNPKLGPGLLEYKYGDIVKVIYAVPEHVPIYPTGFEYRGRKHQISIVDLLAPNPYWKSPSITEEPMAAVVGLFEFPSDYWEEDGDLYFEVGFEGHSRLLKNDGDAAVPIKIVINGPTNKPTLTNVTTGELIKVNQELLDGDVLEIDTGEKSVLLNGKNAFNWIDLSSTFWELEIGENLIEYTAETGQETAELMIYWQSYYVSV